MCSILNLNVWRIKIDVYSCPGYFVSLATERDEGITACSPVMESSKISRYLNSRVLAIEYLNNFRGLVLPLYLV